MQLGRFNIDPTFQFHLRCAAWIALVSFLAAIFGVVWLKIDRYDRLVDDNRGTQAETRRLAARLAAFESRDAKDATLLEAKLRAIGDQQAENDSKSKAAVTKAPFAIESVLPAVVEIVCIDNKDRDTYYTGSGTMIDKAGVILTNRHLLISENGSLIKLCGIGFTTELRAPPRIRYAAAVEAIREESDLAILRITDDLEGKPMPSEFPAISIAGTRDASLGLGVGDPIFIAGYPGIGAETFTFTQGVVSGRVGTELIKTSALIDSGASGGAAFDANGVFVGVPTAAVKGEIGGSLGYIIAGETVDDFILSYLGGKKAASKSR